MKRVKYLFAAITLITAVLCSALFCACNEKVRGKFYSLEQAYHNGWITADELQEIANLHNENRSLEISEIGEKTIKNIKETALNDDKEFEPNAKIEDYKILDYYGHYGDCYVLIINSPYTAHGEVVIDEWREVGGVQFHYTGHYTIKAWKPEE